MSGVDVRLADRADDADLMAFVRDADMAGRVMMSFPREPSYFEALEVEGQYSEVVVGRDAASGGLAGVGSGSVKRVYLNGEPHPIGYLSGLRVAPAYRNGRLLVRIYRMAEKRHEEHDVVMSLTTILEDNESAMGLLTSGKCGLPVYEDLGRYLTLAVSTRRRNPFARHRAAHPRGADSLGDAGSGESAAAVNRSLSIERAAPVDRSLSIERAGNGDADDVAAFLAREGRRRQFFPAYSPEDLLAPTGLLRGLAMKDVFVARSSYGIVGTLALWDQRAFRQSKVTGYGGALRWARGIYNAYARVSHLPSLPPPGTLLNHAFVSLVCVRDDEPCVLSGLLGAAFDEARLRSLSFLTAGFHERDPLLPVVRNVGCFEFGSRLFVAHWEKGRALFGELDGRAPYLEVASL